MKNLLIAVSLAGVSLLAAAKLPALTGEAKMKADETAAKTVWSGKVDAYRLCKAQDQVAARYFKTAKAAGKEISPPPIASQPCADPGPFAYTPGEQKPIEASGAHSPAGNATSPPSTRQPDAVGNPGSKS